MQFTRDLTRGAWMANRFHETATVGGTAGSGFEAYARILHPVPVLRSGRTTTSSDGHGSRANGARRFWRWADIARRHERVMHPLVQSRRLTDDESRMSFIDGWRLGQIRDGFLEPELLADIITRLSPATTTPDDLTVGIWNGFGELQGTGAVYTTTHDMAAGQAEYQHPSTAWVSPEIRQALDQTNAWPPNRGSVTAPQLLGLPGREYLLLTSSVGELANPAWPLTAGIGWGDGVEGVMPQLVWPADAAWCIATEIDFDFTLIGGTRGSIEAVLASPLLESFEVHADDDMTWDGDTINDPREPPPWPEPPMP